MPIKSAIGVVQILIGLVCNISILLYLTFEFSSNAILAGTFITLFNASNQLSNVLKQIFLIWPKLYEHSLYIEDYRTFMEYNPKTIFNGTGELLSSVTDISIREVFAWWTDFELREECKKCSILPLCYGRKCPNSYPNPEACQSMKEYYTSALKSLL